MLDSLKAIQYKLNNDGIYFLPADGHEGDTKVQIFEYADPGEDVGSSPMGKMYDIMFFKFDEDEDIVELDHFEAILIEPLKYISDMIRHGLYGLVARKTTTSYNGIVKGVLDSLKDDEDE
jgi:hypothetical protein